MIEEDYQHNLRATREALAEEAKKYGLLPGLCYRCLYDFVLTHGREYRPTPWRASFARGADRQCYGNAIHLAAKFGLKYIEGVALSPFGDVIPHGWNSTDAGELVDSTWLNTGLVYLAGEAGGGSWHRGSRPRVDTHPLQVKMRYEAVA